MKNNLENTLEDTALESDNESLAGLLSKSKTNTVDISNIGANEFSKMTELIIQKKHK